MTRNRTKKEKKSKKIHREIQEMSPGKRGVKREVCSLTEDALQIAETFKGENDKAQSESFALLKVFLSGKFASLESFALWKVFLSRKFSSLESFPLAFSGTESGDCCVEHCFISFYGDDAPHTLAPQMLCICICVFLVFVSVFVFFICLCICVFYFYLSFSPQ